jgi:hypothetical protein
MTTEGRPDPMDIYVQIALGARKEDAPWPLDAEASAQWDEIAARVREMLDRGDGPTAAELKAAAERLLDAEKGPWDISPAELFDVQDEDHYYSRG